MRAARSKLSAQRLLGITTVAPEDCYAHPQDKQRVNLNTALSVADIPSPIGTKEPARRYAGFYVFPKHLPCLLYRLLMVLRSVTNDYTQDIDVFNRVLHQISSFSEYGPWYQWHLSFCLALACGRTSPSKFHLGEFWGTEGRVK